MHHEQPYSIADWAGPFLICPIIDMAIVNIMLYPPESYHKDGKVCQVEAFALNFRNSRIALMQIRNASVCSPVAFATCMGNKTHAGFSPYSSSNFVHYILSRHLYTFHTCCKKVPAHAGIARIVLCTIILNISYMLL